MLMMSEIAFQLCCCLLSIQFDSLISRIRLGKLDKRTALEFATRFVLFSKVSTDVFFPPTLTYRICAISPAGLKNSWIWLSSTVYGKPDADGLSIWSVLAPKNFFRRLPPTKTVVQPGGLAETLAFSPLKPRLAAEPPALGVLGVASCTRVARPQISLKTDGEKRESR